MPRRIHGVVEVKGTAGVIRNLKKFGEDVLEEIRQATINNGYAAYTLARNICAVDTGRLRKSITLDPEPVTPKGVFQIKLYYDPQLFREDEVPYYAPYVEFGTRFMAAQPAIGPAYDHIAPKYLSEVRQILRKRRVFV